MATETGTLSCAAGQVIKGYSAMFQRMVIALLWAVVALVGSQMVMGFACGVIFFALALAYPSGVITDRIGRGIGHGILLISAGVAIATIVLGVKGKLPGTRSASHSDAG